MCIRDRIITVDDITRIANIEESIEHQKPIETAPDPEPLYKLPSFPRKPDHKRTGPTHPKLIEFKKEGLCFNCGKNHTRKEKCPAKGQECKNCGKKNHFAKACCSEKSAQNKTQ